MMWRTESRAIADELIAAHPDLADELRQFLADHQRIQRLANSSQAIRENGADRQDAATRAGSANSTPGSQDLISFSQSDLSDQRTTNRELRCSADLAITNCSTRLPMAAWASFTKRGR